MLSEPAQFLRNPLSKNLQKLLIRYTTITTTLQIIYPIRNTHILFHLADPDFRAPHLLNTRGGGTSVLRQGVPAFYDENDDDDDGVIVAKLHGDMVIVTLQVALRAVGLLRHGPCTKGSV
jgi:hypothetical protein